MTVIPKILGEVKAPISNYFSSTVFKSILFLTHCSLLSLCNLGWVVLTCLSTNLTKIKGYSWQSQQYYNSSETFYFVTTDDGCFIFLTHNSSQIDNFCEIIDVMKNKSKSQLSYQHIYNKLIFKLFSSLHSYIS